MPSFRELNVFRGEELVGTLYDEEPLRFVYSEAWRKKGADPIEPGMPVSTSVHIGVPVVAYFENLLPEARIREFLQLKYQTTTVFGLLSAVGGDVAGDLVLLPSGDHPAEPEYRETKWEDVAAQFRDPQVVSEPENHEEGLRISLAGAQTKTSLWIGADGKPAIPLGSAPSTHILKPDIRGIKGVWCSAMNEAFIMKLAQAAGIGAAEVEYQPVVKACMLKRYDRVLRDGRITRLHQLDLCQLDGKPSTVKYESDGGPSLARCYRILRENGVPASDTKRLIQWVFFNLYVGNYDSHAKNLSIYYPDDEGARLTPFYDLISTGLYPGLSRKFAFKLGGENRPGQIDRAHIAAMADELNIKKKYALGLGEEIADRIERSVDPISNELMQVASSGSEQTLLNRLSQYVSSNTKKVRARL